MTLRLNERGFGRLVAGGSEALHRSGFSVAERRFCKLAKGHANPFVRPMIAASVKNIPRFTDNLK